VFTSASSLSKTLTVAIGEFPPHTSGLNPDYQRLQQPVTEVFESLGYDVKYTYTSWARALKGVKSGKFDITYPWFETEERKAEFVVSEPLLVQKVVFFHRKDNNFDWQKNEDLEKYVLGSVVDYTARKVLFDMGLTPFTGNTDTYIFKLLYKGRIDAYPATIETGMLRINQLFSAEEASQFTYHNKSLFENDMVLLYSKEKFNNSSLPTEFDKAWLEYQKEQKATNH
jgi:polar amino acid transport system substrate-binding protein